MNLNSGSGVMAGGKVGASNLRTNKIRHPERVCARTSLTPGSIRPGALLHGWKRNGAAIPSRGDTSLEAQWILERVRDDKCEGARA